MEYKSLIRNNPTDDNLTIDHSIWLASRIMPTKGNVLISFAHYQVQSNAATWTCNNSDLLINGLLGLNASNTIVNLESSLNLLLWRGCWVINNQPIIGRGHSTLGLIAPLNTFNIGYRMKNGWTPKRPTNAS